ncbi:hypothetical protein SUGI_0100380 [Cryptomeria japonica]|nr:hypothetical protein SUGI_0100380 [Cryptomeria japonica]
MGGLGIRKINALNKVLIAKIGWTLAKGEADWCSIIKAKYLDWEHLYYNLSTVDLPQGSKLWNNIPKRRVMVREGLKWQLGDDIKVIFWEDFWTEDMPLVNTCFHQIMNHLKGLLGDYIADYLVPGRFCWKDIVHIFNNRPNLVHLAQDLQHILSETRIPLAPYEDNFIWKETQSGSFSVKSAYN